MTTVADIMDRAGRMCSLTSTGWLADTALEAMELKDFLSQTVDDIRDRATPPLNASKVTTITGDGSEDYDLPSDVWRLHRDVLSVQETSSAQRACYPITDPGYWEFLQSRGFAGAGRYYRLQGYPGAYRIGFLSALTSGVTALVSYVSTVWIMNGTDEASDWTSEADVCMFPRRLVESGIVYRFRQRKGLVYEDVRAEYEILMSRYSNDARAVRRVQFGGRAKFNPFAVPIPDYIPEA